MIHAYIIPIATCFIYTLYHVYAFSGTNLLTRCHSASSYFLLFLYSRKAVLEIFSELDETKSQGPIFLSRTWCLKETRRGPRGQPHHMAARPHPLARRHVVRAPRVPTDVVPSPINSYFWENPRHPSHIPWKVPEPPPSSTLTREGSEALPGTLPERGIITGGLYIAMPASGVMHE